MASLRASGLLLVLGVSAALPARADFNTLVRQSVAGSDQTSNAGWHAHMVLGYVGTTGNTTSTDSSFGGRLAYRSAVWIDALRAQVLRISAPGAAAVTRDTILNRTRRALSLRSYLLVLEGADRDPANGYDRRYTAVVGYGYRWWHRAGSAFRTEAGIGDRISVLTTQTRQHEVIGLVSGTYRRRLARRVVFSQTMLYEPGRFDTYLQSLTALKDHLTSQLATNLSLEADYNSAPPPGIVRRTQTITTVSLQYGF